MIPAATIMAGDVVRYDLVLTPGVPGDFDADDDVDLEDFAIFQNCLTGSGGTPVEGCEDASLDGDTDVDTNDMIKFKNCMTGPEIAGSLTCAD